MDCYYQSCVFCQKHDLPRIRLLIYTTCFVGVLGGTMTFTKSGAALAIIFAAAVFSGSPAHAESKDSATTKPVMVTINAGDSLSSIADANKTTWVRIFDANDSLKNPDVINPGDKVRIPKDDEQLPDRSAEYVAQVAATQNVATQTSTTYTTKSYTSSPVNSSSYYVGNGMWCTDYVHSKRPDVAIYGNAGYNWISSAQAAGKSTGSTPRAGAVAVTNGHVAYVESVNADGSYTVSEMGWNYQAGNYNQRTVQPGTFGAFIY
jgi:surface antigen